MRTLIAPDILVETEQFVSAAYTEYTDLYSDKHVLVKMQGGSWIETAPDYTLEEIMAALDGRCYYRKQWTDEVGDIDVCVLHNQSSKYPPHNEQGPNPFRACLVKSPYKVYPEDLYPYSLFYYGTPQPPDISQSWEYRQKFKKEEPEPAVEPELSEVAKVMSSPEPITYEEEVKQHWFMRMIRGPRYETRTM